MIYTCWVIPSSYYWVRVEGHSLASTQVLWLNFFGITLNLSINVILDTKDDKEKNQAKEDGNVNKENAIKNTSEINVI